jgi:hypothetical protein
MTQRNKNGKETATVGKPKYAYAGFNKPFAAPLLEVNMTPAQEDRQNVQIAWLEAAVAAQNRVLSLTAQALPDVFE